MEMWVSGLADTSQSPALGYMEVVHQRDAATLIHAHIAPATEVYTFRPVAAYTIKFPTSRSNVSTHNTVNLSVTFVDPATGDTHPKHRVLDSYWKHCKTKLKRMKGCHFLAT